MPDPAVIVNHSTLVCTLLTLPFLAFIVIAFIDPALYAELSRKDNLYGTGLIEQLTVIVLIPSILAAGYVLIRFWRRFPSWLNQKPRALVELFILSVGLVLPVVRRLKPRSLVATHPWSDRILAQPMCWTAAGFFFLVRLIDWFAPADFPTADAELRELAIAWFLALYLVSYFLRLRATPRATA